MGTGRLVQFRAGPAAARYVRGLGVTTSAACMSLSSADNDAPGPEARGERLPRLCSSVAASVRIVELPGLARTTGDVTDWRDAGGTQDRFRELADAAPTARWTRQRSPSCGRAGDAPDERADAGARRSGERLAETGTDPKRTSAGGKPFSKTFSRIRFVPWWRT